MDCVHPPAVSGLGQSSEWEHSHDFSSAGEEHWGQGPPVVLVMSKKSARGGAHPWL